MKTVLFIDSSGRHFFQQRQGEWRQVDGPSRTDTLWALVNLPDESIEVVDLPRLVGRDRTLFLERRLTTAFPESNCRACRLLSGNWLSASKVMITGLSTAKQIEGQLTELDTTVVGLWGVAALLTAMAKRLSAPDLLLILPSDNALRIIVIKDRNPVLTRFVHCDGDNHADEILLTRTYLENQRIFERGKPMPVLFLGETTAIAARLATAGVNLLPMPNELLPKGRVGWLHPLFNHVVSSPACQLAPLPVRARYLGQRLRRAAKIGAIASLVVGCFFALADSRAIYAISERAKAIQVETQGVLKERDRLSALIKNSGVDPKLVRFSNQFEAREITLAPSDKAFLPLAAAAIAEVPAARVQTLSFRLAANGDGVCPKAPDQQPTNTPAGAGQPGFGSEETASSLPQAEVKLTIELPDSLSPQDKARTLTQISAGIKGVPGVTLLQDPALVVPRAIITGGAGVNTAVGQGGEEWCVSVPWRKDVAEVPGNNGKGAL